MHKDEHVVIVGAGLAGIMAAKTLRQKGFQHVTMIDKSKSVGGRLATRRIENGKADHGAQFFTVRTETLQTSVDEWIENGWIREWFGSRHKRYMGIGGMNTFAKNLAMELDGKLNKKVVKVDQLNKGYQIHTEDGEIIDAGAVIMTPPAPQVEQLIDSGNLEISQELRKKLSQITFHPCFVGLFHLQQSSDLPSIGHEQKGLPVEIERIVDHEKKGISAIPTISVYMKGNWSMEHFEESDEAVLEQIKALVKGYVSIEHIQSEQLKRWRYAETAQPLHQPYLDMGLDAPFLVAGDAFLHEDDEAGRTRFESAFLSGIAAAEALAEKIK
ncbi:FAD-dependent oxidoreductase [Bacillus tianshenii]|nr:FAD-dependent oxidoreductase [Bacillus tianshenii]